MAYPVGFQKDSEGYFIYKAAGADKDYQIDFTKWLNGDTLASVIWTVPAGITKDAESYTPTTARIDLSGGTVNKNYIISCDVETALGNSDVVKFRVVII